ncbi:MAG: molecular chaperone TorD family protein [Kiloniellales bacterium]
MAPFARHNDLRADFFLTMARAFGPPIGLPVQRAFIGLLPQDLAEMASGLGYPVEEALAAVSGEMASIEDPLRILQVYSGLFLTPPAPVHLSTAVYLDGAVQGGSEYEMRQWFARFGLSGGARAGSLADHVDANLAFVGELFARAHRAFEADDSMEGLALAAEARRFLAAYPRRWLPPLRAACARACADRCYPPIYLHLLDILAGAMKAEIARDAAKSAAAAVDSALPAGSSRGIGEPTAEDLAEIAFRLMAAGLSYDHVRKLPQWRDDTFERRRAGGPLEGSIASQVVA